MGKYDKNKFKVDNIDGFLEQKLDHTFLPDWYEENPNTSKRVERLAQLYNRFKRLFEYTRTSIDGVVDSLNDLDKRVSNINAGGDDRKFKQLEGQISDLKGSLDVLSTRINNAEERINSQQTEIDNLKLKSNEKGN